MLPEVHRLLRRVSMTVADASAGKCEIALDGWPLLLVDKAASAILINDLRCSGLFSLAVPLVPPTDPLCVRGGAVGDELFVLVGDVAAVFVIPEECRGTHADVKVVESASGRLLFDRRVRYRQTAPSPVGPWPALLDDRG